MPARRPCRLTTSSPPFGFPPGFPQDGRTRPVRNGRARLRASGRTQKCFLPIIPCREKTNFSESAVRKERGPAESFPCFPVARFLASADAARRLFRIKKGPEHRLPRRLPTHPAPGRPGAGCGPRQPKAADGEGASRSGRCWEGKPFCGRLSHPLKAPSSCRHSHYSSPTCRAERKASCGSSTLPMRFMRFLPSFCFSRSLRLRVMSPP